MYLHRFPARVHLVEDVDIFGLGRFGGHAFAGGPGLVFLAVSKLEHAGLGRVVVASCSLLVEAVDLELLSIGGLEVTLARRHKLASFLEGHCKQQTELLLKK